MRLRRLTVSPGAASHAGMRAGGRALPLTCASAPAAGCSNSRPPAGRSYSSRRAPGGAPAREGESSMQGLSPRPARVVACFGWGQSHGRASSCAHGARRQGCRSSWHASYWEPLTRVRLRQPWPSSVAYAWGQDGQCESGAALQLGSGLGPPNGTILEDLGHPIVLGARAVCRPHRRRPDCHRLCWRRSAALGK